MMVTKDQERQALKKIREIVESLGEDSYIATAFDGVFEIATENIEMDFAGSCRWYIDKYNQASDEIRAVRSAAAKKEEELMAELKKTTESAARTMADFKKLVEDRNGVIESYGAKLDETEQQLRRAEDANRAAQQEIIKLKAKLFDLLYQGD